MIIIDGMGQRVGDLRFQRVNAELAVGAGPVKGPGSRRGLNQLHMSRVGKAAWADHGIKARAERTRQSHPGGIGRGSLQEPFGMCRFGRRSLDRRRFWVIRQYLHTAVQTQASPQVH